MASIVDRPAVKPTAVKWKMTKHCLLGVALHHLTGSAELVTFLSRFGHCSNYSSVLEVETAMGNELVLQETILPGNIRESGSKMI